MTVVVIDVGCARYGGDYSIERLVEEFRPDQLHGFDPNIEDSTYEKDGVFYLLHKAAAWSEAGIVGYDNPGLRGTVTLKRGHQRVVALDLADYILGLPEDWEFILKIDAEGAEYVLLDHLIDRGVDKHLALVWVEWHPLPDLTHQVRRESIEGRIACEVREWTF